MWPLVATLAYDARSFSDYNHAFPSYLPVMLMQILTVYFISGAHKGLTGIVLSRSKKDKYYWVTIGATLPSLRVELPRW